VGFRVVKHFHCRMELAGRAAPHKVERGDEFSGKQQHVGANEAVADISRLRNDIDAGDGEAGVLQATGRVASAAVEVQGLQHHAASRERAAFVAAIASDSLTRTFGARPFRNSRRQTNHV
jgi:hypothetical protein